MTRRPDPAGVVAVVAVAFVAGLVLVGAPGTATAAEDGPSITSFAVDGEPDGEFRGFEIGFDRPVAAGDGGALGPNDLVLDLGDERIDHVGDRRNRPIRIGAVDGDSTTGGEIVIRLEIYAHSQDRWVPFHGRPTIERLPSWTWEGSDGGGGDSGPDLDSGKLIVDTHSSGTVSLPFDAQSDTGGLEPSRDRVNFDEVSVGDGATETVTVANSREESMALGQPRIVGEDADAFRLTTNGSTSLAAGAEATVGVSFVPLEPGEATASLVFEDDGGTERGRVALSGQATGPELVVDPAPVSFEGVAVGERAQREVTVRNAGDEAVTVEGVALVGASGNFSVADPGRFALFPGNTRTFRVSFSPETTAPQSAVLHVIAEDAGVKDATAWVSNTGTKAAVDVTQTANRTTMDVAVTDATDGERVAVGVPPGDENASATLQRVGLVPETSGEFTLNVTAGSEALESSPAFALGDGTTPLGYLSVDHSLSNADIREAVVTVRVRTDRLEAMGSDPGDVSLYRYDAEGERWEAQPTDVRTETDEYVILEATANGFSEWTTAAKRPRFNITRASTNVETAVVGDSVTIQVFVTNTGGADGVHEVALLLDGDVVSDKEATVPEGRTVQVNFERSFDQPGAYVVEVNDHRVGEVNISEGDASVDEGSPTPAGGGGDGGLGLPLFAVALVVGGLGLGGYWYSRRNRQPTREGQGEARGDDGRI